MATLTTQQATSAGITPTVNSAGASGDLVRPGSILRISNANAATSVVTLTSANPATVDGNVVANKAVSIPTTQVRYVYVNDYYRNKATGFATVTCVPFASVSIEVVKP